MFLFEHVKVGKDKIVVKLRFFLKGWCLNYGSESCVFNDGFDPDVKATASHYMSGMKRVALLTGLTISLYLALIKIINRNKQRGVVPYLARVVSLGVILIGVTMHISWSKNVQITEY